MLICHSYIFIGEVGAQFSSHLQNWVVCFIVHFESLKKIFWMQLHYQRCDQLIRPPGLRRIFSSSPQLLSQSGRSYILWSPIYQLSYMPHTCHIWKGFVCPQVSASVSECLGSPLLPRIFSYIFCRTYITRCFKTRPMNHSKLILV